MPKGGGALRGIDEKFEVNAANGTSSFNIPLPLSTGRNNFFPSLPLAYSSRAGNGPFGIGWSIGLPHIQRNTDKQLPRYAEGPDGDIFLFSGEEDLVPSLKDDGTGNLLPVEITVDRYTIKRYRQRQLDYIRIQKRGFDQCSEQNL